MKEHYVSFEQSQALNRLGFDWECLHYYNKEGLLFSNSDSDCEGGGIYVENLEISHNKKNKNYIDAPTLAQAAKWLRDCKGMDIEPRVWFVGDKREYRPYVMPPKCKDYIALPPEESYDIALSHGISNALELLGKEDKE